MNALPASRMDCLVVGGGPAGLVAATNLARYGRQACVVDRGETRGQRPRHPRRGPGVPGAQPGSRLLERILRQAEAAGVVVCRGVVETLARDGLGFVAEVDGVLVRARCVLIATGAIEPQTVACPLPLRRGHPRVWLHAAAAPAPVVDTMQAIRFARVPVDLAVALGARRAGDGHLEVDIRQSTCVPGLYAAGDVVAGLSEVAVAMAEAAVAATAIHRALPPNRH
ncbi:FAD-dependent oxidoreductase [Arenimonas terrae]|uniref:NAD(P)/FAD-dependent oxidoreductase n=1 Tax=Arenimonas terrae TaxID=2546226 RepID=A0A5C4RQK7_9GAMM|nr:FAD-dependent oxidoreductase [Arenimonas terrae]TNJ33254.1 NAD(P)/FAD-dependent oxidoreductase [Arenimonas terrae]